MRLKNVNTAIGDNYTIVLNNNTLFRQGSTVHQVETAFANEKAPDIRGFSVLNIRYFYYP